MDIEGAEIKAILGAKAILEKYKPKLAICLYHKPEDIFENPLLVNSTNPSYKIYISGIIRTIVQIHYCMLCRNMKKIIYLMNWHTFEKIVEQIKEFDDEVRQISLSCHGEK